MIYTAHYTSPLGGITFASDSIALTGLYFDGERDFPDLSAAHKKDLPVFGEVMRWLELYFAGREPDFSPALNPTGTSFQMSVWAILQTIPFGKTTTYGAIARRLEEGTGKRMSAQAVGGAIQSPSSSRATASLVQTAASRAMRADWTKRSICSGLRGQHDT